MKSTKWIMLGIVMIGGMLAAAQQPEPTRTDALQRRQDMTGFAEASTTAKDQGDRFADAADYLKLALVLGLGMLIGRMSAVSHRELKEVKTTLARLAGSNSQ